MAAIVLPPFTAPHSLHCITHLSKVNVLLFASQGPVLSDHICVDWQEHETLPFWTAKTFEHKALFFVSLLIFLERLPTYQILQWIHNHCASVKILPTVMKTHHYNPIPGSSWWEKNSVEYILFEDTSSLAAEVTAQIQYEQNQAQCLTRFPTHFNYLPFPYPVSEQQS